MRSRATLYRCYLLVNYCFILCILISLFCLSAAEKSSSKDRMWYFFCPIEKKYASGSKLKRATETGYWKSTGGDRTVTYKGRTVGKIKTLIFHQGHSGKGERTDWVIHEYRMEDKHLADARIVQVVLFFLRSMEWPVQELFLLVCDLLSVLPSSGGAAYFVK